MVWQRLILAVGIVAMTIAMFIPLPLWGAMTLITVGLVTALGVIVQQVLSQR